MNHYSIENYGTEQKSAGTGAGRNRYPAAIHTGKKIEGEGD
jgi:hypothetical protein